MKYYRKTRIINQGQPNEYIYIENYNIDNLPVNRPIYGLAYDINDDTEHKRLNCLPVLGEIIDVETHRFSRGMWGTHVFVPYKKGTTEKRKSGVVSFQARLYADTYEEAVEMYNELVQQRIDNLRRMIAVAETEKIIPDTNGHKNIRIEIHIAENDKLKHIGYIEAPVFDAEFCFHLCNWHCWTENKPPQLHSDIGSCGHGICFTDPNTQNMWLALSSGWLVGDEAKILNYIQEHVGRLVWVNKE